MRPADLIFYLFAALTFASACVVVFSRNLLYSAFALLFTLSGVAALYGLLGADFLAVTQVLVYVGGILVLILFGVMFTQRIYDVKAEAMTFKRWRAALIGIVVFALLAVVAHGVAWRVEERPLEPTSAGLGDLLLSRFLLPFEVVSVLLLVVLIGAVLVGKKEVED
jgi:NAD(P)H-quinone oxidoreductase subunit 6